MSETDGNLCYQCFDKQPALLMNSTVRIYPALAAALLLLLAACGPKEPPETIVRGTVSDRITGESVEGAWVGFRLRNNGDQHARDFFTHTDTNGHFELIAYYDQVSNYDIHKTGFLSYLHPYEINVGEVNEVELTLLPLNSYLDVTLQNVNGLYDTLYYKNEIPSLLNEFPYFGWLSGTSNIAHAFAIDTDEELSMFMNLPADEPIVIHWDFQNRFKDFHSEFSDTLYLTAQDTTYYLLKY